MRTIKERVSEYNLQIHEIRRRKLRAIEISQSKKDALDIALAQRLEGLDISISAVQRKIDVLKSILDKIEAQGSMDINSIVN